MKILITGARAPSTLEWMRIFEGHKIIFSDPLSHPIASYIRQPNVSFTQIPSPKLNFTLFRDRLLQLFQEVDKVIANCEEIFFVAQVRDLYLQKYPNHSNKFFFSSTDFLLNMHHKFDFLKLLEPIKNTQYKNIQIALPTTFLIKHHFFLKHHKKNLKNYILKPVFSRFGSKVVREINLNKTESLNISTKHPYVLQEKIDFNPLCNYAIFDKGRLIAHVVYVPKYLINQSAGSYFSLLEDDDMTNAIQNFMQEFGETYCVNGQIAFDFLVKKTQNQTKLYITECNPRATSGLHLVGDFLRFKEDWYHLHSKKHIHYRLGFSILFFFGFSSFFKLQLFQLLKDFKQSQDVFKSLGISQKFSLLSLLKMMHYAITQQKTLSSVSTFDIEYNGDEDYYLSPYSYKQTYTHNFLRSFILPSNSSINNANFDLKIFHHTFQEHSISIPCTILNHKDSNQCYSVSLRGMLSIALDEINKINSMAFRFFSRVFICLFSPIIHYIDKIIFFNNYCFSTNLFEEFWENPDFLENCVPSLLEEFTKTYPNHILAFRSVNQAQNPHLFNYLQKNKWLKITSRQIYWINEIKLCMQSSDFKSDNKFLNSGDLRIFRADENSDFNRIVALYNELYLIKYSPHNIQFSAKYLQSMVKNNFIDCYYFKNKNDKIVGVVAFKQTQNAISIPIIGYDLQEQKKYPIYRSIQAFATKYVKEGYFFNHSSGASDFKRSRYSYPEIEYLFVYPHHLPCLKRILIKIISFLSLRVYRTTLQKFKL